MGRVGQACAFDFEGVAVGSGGPITGSRPVLVPEIQNPPDHGAEIWVFEVPEENTGEAGH